MEIFSIETPLLGDRSYLVHDGAVALVIDPQRDIDRLEKVLADAGVRLSHVAETHIHNDYVSGGRALADRFGAAYLVSAGDRVVFERQPVEEGAHLDVGRLEVAVLATPGHTPTMSPTWSATVPARRCTPAAVCSLARSAAPT